MIALTNLPRTWTGALLGGLIGVLWVLFSFSGMLLIVALGAIGAVVGRFLESEELRAKLRELSDVVFPRT